MHIQLLRIVAVLVAAFSLAEASSHCSFLGDYTHDLGYAAFFSAAWADAGNEADPVLVECVLPGKIRPLGSTTYITREQTIKTTRKDCEARGGKPVIPEEPETEKSRGHSAGQDDHSSK